MVEQTTHDIVALALELAGIAALTPDADTGRRLMIVAVRLLEEAGLPALEKDSC